LEVSSGSQKFPRETWYGDRGCLACVTC
jgi:hypothetical protein